ncbi:MAG TPA: aminotransferase class I/II-fold pyridoxal phosphate-dependent enzyme [Candidatus Tumulicola sp.]
MKPRAFSLERYFERYEFSTRYLLCSSDPESMPVRDLLALEPGAEAALGDVWLGYTQSRGDPELRESIAALYERTDADGVLVHGGAEEPIFNFMNVVLEPGDHAIVQFPAYQSHYSIAEALGAGVTRWPSDLAADGAPDPEFLAGAIRPSTRAIVIATPNNPTGYVFDRARLDAVVETARKHGLWLFSDEVYRGTERAAGDRHPAICDLYERGISLGGTSKVYGLAGLRIGWIATRDRRLYARMAGFKDYVSMCNGAASEFLAKLALRHGDALIARVRAITQRNLDLLDVFFARRSTTFEWHRPRAGTTAFPRYLGGSAERLCDDLVRRAGVLLLPSTAFDAGDDRVRVGYGRTNLPDALAAMDAALT